MPHETKSPWNSLEVAKLFVTILLPISLAVFGLWVKQALQSSEAVISAAIEKQKHEQILSRELVSKRREIYENIRVPLNNIYCYIEEVGGYKHMTPDTINNDRRYLHKEMHSQRAYWSPETFSKYLEYMDEIAFRTWQGLNTDAPIQDDPGQKSTLNSWKVEWGARFKGPQHPKHKQTYDELLDLIAVDLAANVSS